MKSFIVSGVSTPSYRSRSCSAKVKFKASAVDETLFTKPKINHDVNFEPPWVDNKIRKPQSPINVQALLDKVVSNACKLPNSDNEIASRCRSVPSFKSTVVEEELFGKKPLTSSFPAPWEKKERRSRPLLCSPMNYKERWRIRQPGSGNSLHPNNHRWRPSDDMSSYHYPTTTLLEGQFSRQKSASHKQKPRPPWKP